jgi:hypothetical protein
VEGFGSHVAQGTKFTAIDKITFAMPWHEFCFQAVGVGLKRAHFPGAEER